MSKQFIRLHFVGALAATSLATGLPVATVGETNQPAGPVHPAMMQETAKVVELTLQGYTSGDTRVVVYLRGGTPYWGYILEGVAPNMPQLIVTQPAGAHGLYDAATGKELDYYPPELADRYGYKLPRWQKFADDYATGKLIARRDPDPTPLTVGADTIAGTMDIPRSRLGWCVRLKVDAKRDGQGYSGTWEARPYNFDDPKYGRDKTPTTGTLTARVADDSWALKPGAEFAKGKDWPQTHGPHLNMSAIDCGQPMINKIEDARLAWVSEEPIGGGKGAVNKAAFGVGPLTPNDIDGGDYCAPIVYDGKVYLYYIMTDFTAALNTPGMTNDIVYIRGAPPGSQSFGHYVHRYLCVDARTGKTLWRKDTPWTGDFHGEKQGVAQTPAIVEGVLVHRNGGTLIGMHPADGKVLWTNPKCGGAGGYWSHENSIIGIGGVVLAGVDDGSASGLAGFDPKTGAELWRLKRVRGFNQIASQVILDGNPYILSALGPDANTPTAADQRLVLIEPKTGRILWEDGTVGLHYSSMAVTGDIAALNITPFDQMKDAYNSPRVGAYRISLKGAERLWANQQINFYRDRNTPAAYKDRIVLDSAATGFAALDAATGAIRGRDQHIYSITGGDHNWTWHIITDGKVVTSGLLLFDLYPELKRAEGQLRLQAASGYMCPVKPAIADGRLFMRSMYHLVCYDLRAGPAQLKVEAALKAAAGKPEAEVNALCALMLDQDAQVRYQAAQSLVVRVAQGGAVNSTQPVRQALVAGVTDDNPSLNVSISKALGAMGVDALPELAALAKADSPVARQLAQQTVGRIGGEDDARISQIVALGLGDKDATVRLAAAESAENCLPATAGLVPQLAQAVDDDSEAVGKAAVRSLLLALPADQGPAVVPKRYGDRLALLLDLWGQDALLGRVNNQIKSLGDDEALRVAVQVLEGDSALRGIRACHLLAGLGPKAVSAIPKIEAARDKWATADSFMKVSAKTLDTLRPGEKATVP